ncbi:hypothetical protein SUGI_1059140 [Cryptomeria japonica]|nr:hypothetical protein SUGI_1059140 [Cryptomeria japonica]
MFICALSYRLRNFIRFSGTDIAKSLACLLQEEPEFPHLTNWSSATFFNQVSGLSFHCFFSSQFYTIHKEKRIPC